MSSSAWSRQVKRRRVDLLRVPARVHEEKCHAMALDKSALLELFEVLKLTDVDERSGI